MGSPSTEDLPEDSVATSDSKLPRDNVGHLEYEDDEKNKTKDGCGNCNVVNVDLVDEDEDEEEDVDFNPFLKGSPSQEASSSLSSEGLDADIIDSGVNSSEEKLSSFLLRDIEAVKEIETETELLPGGVYSAGAKNSCSGEGEEGKYGCISQPESRALNESSFMDMDDDEEDAICKRTRARYSLAKFTLDELETFLQETDDEDDMHNVDDEEEYRKFLAAVLLGGDDDSHDQEGNKVVDDDDDDNDADFELEIEEALESDNDENKKSENSNSEGEAVGRRHKSRRNRLRQSAAQHSHKSLPASNRPLRPLVPFLPIKNFSALNGGDSMPKEGPQCPTNGLLNGFTPHQIGQLHCLLHEHVQLLIQVFSVCALDPARRQIAFDVQKLIQDMLRKREQVLDWKRVKQSSLYCVSPYAHPIFPGHHLSQPPSRDNVVPPNTVEGACWVPYTSGPLLSVMDVVPLRLTEKYLDDVSTAVSARKQIELGVSVDTCYEKEALFPLSCSSQLPTETDVIPKMTMAAALVEKAKKQSIVSVPKEIAKLAFRFYPWFNPLLYPHEPPAASVANRVLFTDSEDELLALGMLEFNTDWKAIQQCFLPCKTKHQIFVRQKNRSSSKAPENPIKAVRRMKNSPLTADEIARIGEGLKFFKHDWVNVWKFVVPYRDPTLLTRQWRIANGTQKSYKAGETIKAKRRLPKTGRKMCKTSTSSDKEDHGNDNTRKGNNSGEKHSDREDEAYLHEAFLADWMPGTSSIPPSVSGRGAAMHATNPSQDMDTRVREEMNSGFRAAPATLFRSSSCQPPLSPYRVRKRNNAHLVKLAPNLPPVNLPPTVRIMSQSAFKVYEVGASNTYRCADRHTILHSTENDTLTTASTLKPGVNDSTEVSRKKNRVGETSFSYHDPHVSEVSKDKSGVEENDNSTLQMHPLLFQAPEAGHHRYPPLHHDTSTPTCSPVSTFSFSSGKDRQLNLSLFPNFRGARHTVNLLDKYLRHNELASSSGIDFHPLLQKDDSVNSELINLLSTSRLCASPELLRGGSSQNQYPCGASPNKSYIQGSPSRPSASPSSPYEKSNELDLDIHLSFRPGKQKVARRRDLTQSRMTTSVATSPNFGAEEPRNEETLSNQRALSSHTADQLMLLSNNQLTNNFVSTGDQSLPGIVMEKEELSDSDEEQGENVEFECEEMTDSDGEEASDSKGKPNSENEVERVSAGAGLDDQRSEVRVDENDASLGQEAFRRRTSNVNCDSDVQSPKHVHIDELQR